MRLWLHIGEVKGLVIGLSRVESVGRRANVAVVVARSPIRIRGKPEVLGQQWVARILVGVRLIAVCSLHHVALKELVARPSLRLFRFVPFYGEVQTVFGCFV